MKNRYGIYLPFHNAAYKRDWIEHVRKHQKSNYSVGDPFGMQSVAHEEKALQIWSFSSIHLQSSAPSVSKTPLLKIQSLCQSLTLNFVTQYHHHAKPKFAEGCAVLSTDKELKSLRDQLSHRG